MIQLASDIESFTLNLPDEFAIVEHSDGRLEICLGPFEASEQIIAGEKNILFCDFFLAPEQKFLKPSGSFIVSVAERNKFRNSNFKLQINWEPLDENLFQQAFDYYKEAISTGELVKAVPVSFQKASFDGGDTEGLLNSLIIKLICGQPGLYSYGIRRGKYLMLGASPEILFNLDRHGNKISTEAVAGSILGPSAPIKQITDKLIEEQQLVVDDLLAQLAEYGEVIVSEVKLKNLSTLCHLKSDIVTSCHKDVSAQELIYKLHPSGALGLLPRKSADSLHLKSLDLSDSRESFGAPFGLIDQNGSAQIIVAIRNLIIHGDQIKIGAGVGITAKSEFNSELQEIKAKHMAVRKFFNLIDE